MRLLPPRNPAMRMMKFLLVTALISLGGCASMVSPGNELEKAQYAWSGAIRWGDFEGAMNLVDPTLRGEHEPTSVELERYKQVQISSYRDVGASADIKGGTAMRNIEIGVVNRHTQSERNVRYREQWRWDPVARTWWLTTSLPDLWAGQ